MEFNLESQIYKLYELRTQLKKGIEHYETLFEQYTTLIGLVKESGKEESLPENFADGLEDYKSQLAGMLPQMKLRVSYLDLLIAQYEESGDKGAKVDEIVTLLFNSLGIDQSTPEEATEEN